MRPATLLVVVAAWVALATGAFAQSSPVTDQPIDQPADQPIDQPADQPVDQPPPGPSLQPSDHAPQLCDPATPGFRYVEVRGSGFDAWATQRLVGNLLDGNGIAQQQWGSVWVSPQGVLTLEVNLCSDPFRGRPSLPVGTYTVAVGSGSGAAIAATSIDVSPPPEPPAEGEIAAPLPVPRTGSGTRQQPFARGTPGLLADGWQLVVTSVIPDAWADIHNAVPSAIAPPSDQRDFLVGVQAIYQGQGTGVLSAIRLVLVNAGDNTYDQLHNGCGALADMVPPNLVTSGGGVRGNICFTVRAADIGALVLVDNQASDEDKRYFALQ